VKTSKNDCTEVQFLALLRYNVVGNALFLLAVVRQGVRSALASFIPHKLPENFNLMHVGGHPANAQNA
jgi:hypothetical protein